MLAKICAVAGALCLLFSAVPVVGYGILNMGVLFLFLFGTGLVLYALLAKKLRKPWRRAVNAVFAVVMGYIVVMSGIMAVQAWFNPPPADKTVVVVVLGAKINGRTPSLMLRHRLNAAARYLEANPDVICIVSGGQGADEQYPEAQVMKEYLVACGIDPDRVFEEDRSTNTRENLAFSADIIAELYGDQAVSIAIATDSFHQLRAAIYGASLDLDCSAIPSVSPWGLFPSYWVRELLGIPVAWMQSMAV